MYNKVSSQYLFQNSKINLQRIYQLLDKESLDGLSADDLSQYDLVSSNDLSFVQLLQQDFSKIDTDNNGNLTTEEYDKMINTISEKGLTYEQLLAMSSQAGMMSSTDGNQSLMQTVIENFDKIDLNNDGRVSQAEIDDFNIEKEIAEKKEEFGKISSSNYSIMYGEDSDSSESDES